MRSFYQHPWNLRISHLICLLFFLLFSALPEFAVCSEESFEGLVNLDERWTGDFDVMVKRRKIRALVTFNHTNYFLDHGRQRGLSYRLLKEFEKSINQALKRKHLKINIIFLPVTRDELIPMLEEGRADIAVASLTITPERQKRVDFSIPVYKNVNEILVTGPTAKSIQSLNDLSGKVIYVNTATSYYESLLRLNDTLRRAEKPPIKVKTVDEHLETEDIIEMVNAGLIPMTIADNYLVEFWKQIFDNLTLHPEIAVRTGGQIAWMVRKNTPNFLEVVNKFLKQHKKGTLIGNILFKRYLKNTRWVRNSLTEEELRKFQKTINFFKKYAGSYDFDWMMIMALAYQESHLDQSKRSPAGAIGVMQLLPDTAAGHPIYIDHIEILDNNIRAGVRYLRWIFDEYYKDLDRVDLLDKVLFTFASYNAGPTRVVRLRDQTSEMGLDPNKWFNNVEITAAKKIGRETVQYVSNIYKYWIAYRMVLEQPEDSLKMR